MKWVEKYAPKSLGDVLGNAKIKAEIEVWANKWVRDEPQPPLLLAGPPGVGKTTMAHLTGKEYFSETIEVNASDKRSYNIIKKSIGESSQTRSLFHSGYKLLIMDEVDGLSGRDDKNGGRAVNNIIKSTKQPLILMANDLYDKKLATIKRNAKVLKFNKIHTKTINAQLRRICQRENIEYDPEALMQLSQESKGDLRSAITSLEAIVDSDNKVTKESIDALSRKDVRNNIFDTVRTILMRTNVDAVKEAMQVDEQPQFLVELIAENIPRAYDRVDEIARAYEMIALADLNLTRAFKTQNYTYWRYAFLFMGRGVADAKEKSPGKFVQILNSTIYSRMSKARKNKTLRQAVTQKMSVKLHTSPGQVEEQIPYYEELFKDNEQAYDLKEYFKLTDDEVKLFRSRKIPKSVEKAREKKLKQQQKKEEEEILKQQQKKEEEKKLKQKQVETSVKTEKKTGNRQEETSKYKVENRSKDKSDKNKQKTKNPEDKTLQKESGEEDKSKSKQTTLFDFS